MALNVVKSFDSLRGFVEPELNEAAAFHFCKPEVWPIVQKEHSTIARRFNAGFANETEKSRQGRLNAFRPSLRDLVSIATVPGVETPGYCQKSLPGLLDLLRPGSTLSVSVPPASFH